MAGRKESGTAYVEHFIASVGASVTMIHKLRDRSSNTKAVTDQVTNETLLVSSPGFGVLDSGCGKSIMGQKTFEGFVDLWKAQGIVPEPYAETNHFRFGNGQRETSEMSVKAQVVLAGKIWSRQSGFGEGGGPTPGVPKSSAVLARQAGLFQK